MTTTTFKVSARTIFQLGAELISSDAVAFYELIKNAVDAKAPKIDVHVDIRIRQDTVEILRDLVEELGQKPNVAPSELASLRDMLLDGLDSQPSNEPWRNRIANAATLSDFEKILDEVNEIVIRDNGHGMSLLDLQDVYLTIGTPVRKYQRKQAKIDDAPILGEKGIGRLSVMRLGWKVRIKTARTEDTYWNVLEIDWRRFAQDDAMLIEEIELTPKSDERDRSLGAQGTTLTVTGLRSTWSDKKMFEETVGQAVARMMDPFSDSARFPVNLWYNGERVTPPRLSKRLLPEATATLKCRFLQDSEGLLYLQGELAAKIKVGKTITSRAEPFSEAAQELASKLSDLGGCEFVERTIRRLGPFSMEMYWFNRKDLQSVDGIGTLKEVRDLVNAWTGGLMVFRDGFRVGQYGGRDDDWLDLDKTAMGSSGYKLNKAQVIGKVDVSSKENPYLVDQTNREGLADGPEKAALKSLLKWVIKFLSSKLNQWEKDAERAEPEQVIQKKFESAQKAVARAQQVASKMSTAKGEEAQRLNQELVQELASMQDVLPQARTFVDRAAFDRAEVIHLAGVGLLLEIIAHELVRSVGNSLAAITKARQSATGTLAKTLVTLEAGLRTIDKRLSLLDPLSTSGRQRKEEFDLVEWVQLIVDSHEEQFAAAGIMATVTVRDGKKWPVKMVRGFLLQVIENLLSNSLWWLEYEKRHRKTFEPRIDVVISVKARTICITDNGPGIADAKREEVFLAHRSYRPDGETHGHGLGLYIARENAKYHEATLEATNEPLIHKGRSNTLVLTLSKTEST
jgi:signal transduction histidine kinase